MSSIFQTVWLRRKSTLNECCLYFIIRCLFKSFHIICKIPLSPYGLQCSSACLANGVGNQSVGAW